MSAQARVAIRWQDRAVLAAALWLYVSPFLFGIATLGDPAAVLSWACAVVLMVSSSEALAVFDPVEEWMDGAVGVVLMAGPWLLDFTDEKLPAANSIVVGLAVTLCATSALGRQHAPR
jgi:hypothetical protein